MAATLLKHLKRSTHYYNTLDLGLYKFLIKPHTHINIDIPVYLFRYFVAPPQHMHVPYKFTLVTMHQNNIL